LFRFLSDRSVINGVKIPLLAEVAIPAKSSAEQGFSGEITGYHASLEDVRQAP
jgi:hypothetical protein